MTRIREVVLFGLAAILAMSGCKDNDTPTQPAVDTTPPAAVTSLALGSSTASSVTLTWTAPGDDGAVGTATQYDVRYATANIEESSWGAAMQATGAPAPQLAGAAESFTVTGLQPATPYYFALKTRDEQTNWSLLSNVFAVTTSPTPDTTPPGATTLAAASHVEGSVTLTWTAPGDDGETGSATGYDIRYASAEITPDSWASANQATGEPAPQTAGAAETFTVSGLALDGSYHFAMKSRDEASNWSELSNSVLSGGSPLAETPDLLMAKFKAAYGGRMSAYYVTVLAPSYQFILRPADVRLGDSDRFTCADELGIAGNMFSGNPVSKPDGTTAPGISAITMGVLIREQPWSDVGASDPDFPLTKRSLYTIQIAFARAGYNTIIVTGSQEFFVSARDTLISGVTRQFYRLRGQRDLSNGSKATENSAWGAVKKLYR